MGLFLFSCIYFFYKVTTFIYKCKLIRQKFTFFCHIFCVYLTNIITSQIKMAGCKTTVKHPIIIDCTGQTYDIGISTRTFSSTGLLTSFSFNHLFGSTPNCVTIEALTQDARDYSHITYNSTSVTIHYPVAPPVGTNNLIFNVTIV